MAGKPGFVGQREMESIVSVREGEYRLFIGRQTKKYGRQGKVLAGATMGG